MTVRKAEKSADSDFRPILETPTEKGFSPNRRASSHIRGFFRGHLQVEWVEMGKLWDIVETISDNNADFNGTGQVNESNVG